MAFLLPLKTFLKVTGMMDSRLPVSMKYHSKTSIYSNHYALDRISEFELVKTLDELMVRPYFPHVEMKWTYPQSTITGFPHMWKMWKSLWKTDKTMLF